MGSEGEAEWRGGRVGSREWEGYPSLLCSVSLTEIEESIVAN